MMDNVQLLMDKISDWSDETFGEQRVDGMIAHLKREVKELAEAFERGYQDEEDKAIGMKKELADCWMLLLDITSHCGISAVKMEWAIWDNLKKNRKK